MVAGSVKAQQTEGIAGFIQSGYLNTHSSKFFKQVYTGNAFSFADNYFLIGAEGFYRKNQNIILAEWQLGLQKTYSFNDEHAGIVYEAVLAKYGRIIKEKKNFWFYPSAGAGTSVTSLTSHVGNKENWKSETLRSPAFDIGLNTTFLMSKLKWDEGYYLGWVMEIRTGYRFSIKSNEWKENNNNNDFYKINRMPSYSNSQFYITASIGGGSFDRK